MLREVANLNRLHEAGAKVPAVFDPRNTVGPGMEEDEAPWFVMALFWAA